MFSCDFEDRFGILGRFRPFALILTPSMEVWIWDVKPLEISADHMHPKATSMRGVSYLLQVHDVLVQAI